MLLHLLNYSQKTWPQIQLIDSDTVCVISIDQVKVINKTFSDKDECEEMNDSLFSQIISYVELIDKTRGLVASQDRRIEIQHTIIDKKDIIISNTEAENAKNKKKIKFLKLQRGIASGIIGVLLVLFIL